MNESTTLRDATVQEIQYELLRRTEFNALHGERIAASLVENSNLWVSFLLDRPGVPDFPHADLLIGGLIRLRDIPDNFWNADKLFILTPSQEAAEAMAQIAEKEDWAGDVRVHKDQDRINRSVGDWYEGYGLVTVWWD